MKSFIVGNLVVICLASFAHCGTDYCKTSCGDKNIGCNNNATLKSGCPSGASIVNFTSTDIQLILDEHNGYRNTVANGSLKGFDACVRMAKMVWDDELAYLAALNTRNCTFAHDACRNTDKFKMAGQNIGQVGASPNEPATTDSIKGIMLGFYNEYKDTNMSDIRKFSSAYTANGTIAIGHFTQLVWANSTAVGCGATRFPQNGTNFIVMACNYAVGNVGGWPVYLTSDKPGSGCTSGTDSTYKALCTDKENIDPNNMYQS